MKRQVYVYRLVVVVPPESLTDPEWRPANWEERVEEIGYDPFDSGTDEVGAPVERPWSWPKRRTFLSGAAASRNARRMREQGAAVTVERSEPVRFASSDSHLMCACGLPAVGICGHDGSFAICGAPTCGQHGHGGVEDAGLLCRSHGAATPDLKALRESFGLAE